MRKTSIWFIIAVALLPAACRRAETPPTTAPATRSATSAVEHPQIADEEIKKGANWPSFRGTSALTGVVPEGTAKLPEKLTQLWKYDAGAGVSTAAIVGDRVYVGTQNNSLVALNLNDGKLLWEFKTGGSVLASPCVVDGRVFVGDDMGNFYAVDAAKGAQLWTAKTRDKIFSSAVVVDGNVLVGSYDHRLRCFDAATGKEKWSFAAGAQIHCSPAIFSENGASAAVIAGCDTVLRIIDLKTGEERTQGTTDDACAASPAIFDGNAYVGNLRGDFLSVNLKTGEPAWRITGDDSGQPLGGISSSAAVAQDAVFFATQEGKLVRAARKTGKIQWVFTSKGGIDSSPTLADGRVFFGSGEGIVYAVDAESGKSAWEFVAGGQIKASPAIAHGRLVIGNTDGALYCFGKER